MSSTQPTHTDRPRFDLLIAGGTVFDGTGKPGSLVDIGITGEHIAAIGNLRHVSAARTLEAENMIVCPGFIDAHTHCHVDVDKGIFHCDNLLRQGITTVIAGNCGKSGWPISEHLQKVETNGFKTNYATLIGHQNLRAIATDEAPDQPLSTLQKDRMRDLVSQGMQEGAFGVTTGYIGAGITTEELIDFARPAAKAGGIYASHIRSEGSGLLEAVEEIIEIAEHTGIKVEISHLKTLGPSHWDKLDHVFEMIEQADSRGIRIRADRYPYIAGHGGSTNMMPGWCHAEAKARGGFRHLKDADVVASSRTAVEQHVATFGGPDKLMFTPLRGQDNEITGKTAADLAALWQCDLLDVAIELEERSRKNGPIGAMIFAMSEDNLRRILAHPMVMIGTDGHLEMFGTMATHPRNYGTYPRFFGEYVRDLRLVDWAEAIGKATYVPAMHFGIKDRGVLVPGAFADIVVFDPATVADNATYVDAHHYPEGIPYVIVNGKVAIDNGVTQSNSLGHALRFE